MDFNTGCFLAFGLLFIGFLVLEGFDYGVGMLLPFLGKTDQERQAILNTLAPVWEGNEVWLIAAGAVLFAAFPVAYSALFSGLYLVLLLILTPLILRGVAFEFRNKVSDRRWRDFWDWSLFSGSVLPAFFWGVMIGNLLSGLPFDANGQYSGTFGDLINPYGIVAGLLFGMLFLLHGSIYLLLKADCCLWTRVEAVSVKLCRLVLFISLLFAAYTYLYFGPGLKPITGILFLFLITAVLVAGYCLDRKYYLRSFSSSALAITVAAVAIFTELYPRIAVSSLDSRWSLDIYNAASNQLTLKIISITLGGVIPVVIGIEVWKYHVFRHRSTIAEIENTARTALVSQMNHELMELIKKANCVTDILQRVAYAFRGGDRHIERHLKREHRCMLSDIGKKEEPEGGSGGEASDKG